MKNQVQLCTYVDRLAAGGIDALAALLDGPLAGVFAGVHLLPFYYPIDGSDAGFDPIDHTRVEPRLGHWADIKRLAGNVEVMADVIVNHVSSASPQFVDYLARGAASPYAGMFLEFERIFPHGATEQDLLTIYRPRPGLPFTIATLKSGERKVLWTTFTSQQIDIDVRHPQGRAYLQGILATLADHGVKVVRLDAVGYAIKKAGTRCFMLPETMDFVREFVADTHQRGIEVLVEIHSHHRTQIEIARHVDWVYDFALPPLILHALFFGSARYLKEWITIRPHNAITVLDTHDGIGVIDIGADADNRAGLPGLVPPGEISRLVDRIHANSAGTSKLATGAAASNLDIYQVNCTYYDALGRDDSAYLMARAIQFFLPGIPQVYYVGLLAGENDMALLASTGVGRDINRHYYRRAEIELALKKPVVAELLQLIRFRNSHPAFSGTMQMLEGSETSLQLSWETQSHFARLDVDFVAMTYRITHSPIEAQSAPRPMSEESA